MTPRQRNGTAKWLAIFIAGTAVVGGATAAHTAALAQIKSNTEQIDELKGMADSVRLIEHAVLRIAAFNNIEVKLD